MDIMYDHQLSFSTLGRKIELKWQVNERNFVSCNITQLFLGMPILHLQNPGFLPVVVFQNCNSYLPSQHFLLWGALLCSLLLDS
nr:hypothetical transcript [Hymenolepis microstoma]